MIKNIIFDWSHVCTQDGISDSISRAISESIRIEKEVVKKSFKKTENDYVEGRITGKMFLVQILEDLEINSNQIDLEELKVSLVALPQINEEVLDLVKSLRSHYKIILFSDNFKEMTDLIVEKYKLNDVFDELVFSHEYKTRKPNEFFYQKMIESTRIDPKESIFIDDKAENLKVAERFGMKTILFKTYSQLKLDLISLKILTDF